MKDDLHKLKNEIDVDNNYSYFEGKVLDEVLFSPGLKSKLDEFREEISVKEDRDVELVLNPNEDLTKVRKIVVIKPEIVELGHSIFEEDLRRAFQNHFPNTEIKKIETDTDSTRLIL